MTALTKQQARLLRFIKAYQRREKVSPSFDEMRESLALKSKSGVHRLISGLEERGYIRRLYNRARAIEVLPDPCLPDHAALHGAPIDLLVSEVRRRGFIVGCYHREGFKDLEGKQKSYRRFVEMAA